MKGLTWIAADAPPDAFPPLDAALDDPPGLLAAGGDLSTARLVAAYARGIFPWYMEGQPVLWWSPDPREVLFPAHLHRSRSLLKQLRRGDFRITENQAFLEVVEGCAAARSASNGTWITPAMQAAYVRLHRAGHAHSIEVWRGATLVGGLYGVRSRRVFSGESMYSRESNASKAALSWLAAGCASRGIELIDCQMPSAHLRSLGSQALPRSRFLALLENGRSAS
ncbi:MAG: leucyl/phenylalanyl-tRNA--protein transferase [Steroidobacteraceae bacterium]